MYFPQNSFPLRCFSSFPTFSLFNVPTKTSSKSIFPYMKRNAYANRRNLSNSVERITRQSIPEKSSTFSHFYSKMSTPVPEKSKCIFCNIVNKVENTEILYEDEEVCVFRDIKPASKFHILTVPKRHIDDCKSLTSADKELVQHMLSVARDQIQRNNLSLEDARLGYHWPPFRSVKHLHLHAIAPESEMGFIGKLIFKSDSYWFVSPDYVASRL